MLYRSGEKEILVFWLETAETMINWMNMPLKESSSLLKHHKRYDQWIDYYNGVLVSIVKGLQPYAF